MSWKDKRDCPSGVKVTEGLQEEKGGEIQLYEIPLLDQLIKYNYTVTDVFEISTGEDSFPRNLTSESECCLSFDYHHKTPYSYFESKEPLVWSTHFRQRWYPLNVIFLVFYSVDFLKSIIQGILSSVSR